MSDAAALQPLAPPPGCPGEPSALAAELDRYRACVDAAPAFLYELSLRTGELGWVSASFETLLGHPPADVLGARARWGRLVHPRDRAAVDEAMRAARDHGRYEIELRFRHAAGRWRWFRSAGTVGGPAGETPDAVRGIALMHDEQHRLTVREHTYRRLVDGVSASVIGDELLVHVVEAARRLLDARRAKLYVADTAARLLRNAAQSGAVAVPLVDLAMDDADSLVARCFRTGRAERVDDYAGLGTPLATRLRANRPGPVLAVPVLVGGAPAAVLVVTREPGEPTFTADDVEDATYLGAQASVALANAPRDEPAADGGARSACLSMLGHELRSPLNTIDGFLELLALETPGPLTPRQRDYLGRIRRASGQVLRLAEDLLDLSRAELGQARIALAPFDVREPLRHAAELVRLRAARDGIRLEVDEPPAAIHALGDAGRVRQILVNVLATGLKFATAGHVRATAEGEGGRGRVRYRVTAAGEAIPPELRELIFEPFFQGPARRRRDAEDCPGAGLGLAVSRSLARAMGGELAVAGAPGGGAGSAFTLTLPGAPAAGATAGGARGGGCGAHARAGDGGVV